MSEDQEIPESIQTSLFHFHDTISSVEDVLAPFFSKPLEETEITADPLQKAKIELMAIFAANSLHWMYLCTRGESPVQHPILEELGRIKKYMDRLKELEERVKAPKLDKKAAKNFVRSALWEPNNNQDSIEADTSGKNQSDSGIGHSSSDLIEQQLDEVLKRYKSTATHKRFADDEDKEGKEVAVESKASEETETGESPVKRVKTNESKRKKKKTSLHKSDE